ncbi:hypothetical protein SVIOM74S_10424 [Streptomyces violarus]
MPSSGIFSRSVREAETTSRVSLSARATPRASRMEPPDGRLDDLLDVVPRRLLGVRRALTDLEVPQASAEGEQEGEDEDLDDDEPDLDP